MVFDSYYLYEKHDVSVLRYLWYLRSLDRFLGWSIVRDGISSSRSTQTRWDWISFNPTKPPYDNIVCLRDSVSMSSFVPPEKGEFVSLLVDVRHYGRYLLPLGRNGVIF